MMTHLDEGTIHAWLDGALDAAQSAEAEAHVTSCAECSAKVAEARGLIAASSRILTALDDTPANVMPRRTVAPGRRRWGAAPWISGLAAAAILVTLWRSGGVEQPTPQSELKVPDVAVTLSEPALRPVAPAPPVVATPPTVRQSREPLVANAPQPEAGRGSGAVGSVATSVGAAGATAGAASDLASAARAPASPAPSPAEAGRALRDESQRREAFAAEAMQRSEADTATVVGCYRLAALEEIVVTSVNESRAPERLRRASGAPAPAAAAAAPAAQKLAVAPVLIVRLDSGNVVRMPASDSTIGSWVALRADSARVVLGGQTNLVSRSSKVRCP